MYFSFAQYERTWHNKQICTWKKCLNTWMWPPIEIPIQHMCLLIILLCFKTMLFNARVINNANETSRNTCGKYAATIHVHVNSCVKAFLIRYIHIYTHTNELCTRPWFNKRLSSIPGANYATNSTSAIRRYARLVCWY